MPWYYANAGQQSGPVSDEEFDQLILNGTLQPSTLVWREGMASWQPLSSVRPAAPGPLPGTPPSTEPTPSAVPAPGQVVCQECRKAVPAEDTVLLGGLTICSACKPIAVQRLREGAMPSGGQPGVLRYAGFWIRFAAKVIDGIVMFVATLPLSFIFGFSTTFMPVNPSNMPALTTLLAQQGIIVGLGTLIRMVYTWLMVAKYGATLGKMAVGLKVVMADGKPLTSGRAFGRFWAEMVNGFTCAIGYIIAGFDDQKRSLHDHICNTRVIHK